jgi:hypothetical protein
MEPVMSAPPKPPDLFVEKRAEPQRNDPPQARKDARAMECRLNQCRPQPGRMTTDCCGRAVFSVPAPGAATISVTPPAALQPAGFEKDFDVAKQDPDWWDRRIP